jgi:hypothetical protein
VRLPRLEHALAQLPSTGDMQLDEQPQRVAARRGGNSLQPLMSRWGAVPPEDEVKQLQTKRPIM